VGLATERDDNLGRMLAMAVAVLIGSLLVLQAAFGGWRLAAALLVVLPLSLVGGLPGAVVDGAVVSLGSIAGFLAVLAIATRHGVGFVARIQELEREGVGTGAEVVLRAAHDRMAPVVMSAVATGLTFAPLFLLGDRPGLELLRPMAAVIEGGLVSATLLSLFVVPAVCLRLRSTPEPAVIEQPVTEPQPQPQTSGAS